MHISYLTQNVAHSKYFREWEPSNYFVGGGGWLVKYFDFAGKTFDTFWSKYLLLSST